MENSDVSVGKPTRCIADEVEPGVFLRKDEKTDEVKSVGILGFRNRSKSLKDIELMLPVELKLIA